MVYFAVKIKKEKADILIVRLHLLPYLTIKELLPPHYKYFVIYSLFFFCILRHQSRYWLTFSLPITEEFLP